MRRMSVALSVLLMSVFVLASINVHAGIFDFLKKKDSPKVVEQDIPNIPEKDLKAKPVLGENVEPPAGHPLGQGFQVYPRGGLQHPTVPNTGAYSVPDHPYYHYVSDKLQLNKEARDALRAARGDCPAGQYKFYYGDWDTVGFCAKPRDPHCLPHYLYVEHPLEGTPCAGFTRSHSGSVDGEEILGGYECFLNPYDTSYNAASSNPPPNDATCPPNVHLGGNQLQYSCFANQPNTNVDLGGCTASNYELVWEGSSGSPASQYQGIKCGFEGFRYPWEYRDRTIPCVTPALKILAEGGILTVAPIRNNKLGDRIICTKLRTNISLTPENPSPRAGLQATGRRL